MRTRAPSSARLRLRAGLCIALLVASCGREDAATTAARTVVARERAERASDELGRRLMGELTAVLATGSAVDGIEVCARVAQPIGAEVRAAQAFAVGRTSLRVRNPANAPDAYERAQLEAWQAAEERGEPISTHAEVFEDARGARELRYMRPIRVMDLCTRCHGASADLDPALRAALAERYPADQAVGYAPGDLRGAFTARVPLKP